MPDFWIKQNDTAPSLAATLKDADGNAVDLTGASVRFHAAPSNDHSSVKIDADAVVVDAAAGKVRYDFAAADTDTAGTFDAEWEVTYTDTTIESFPSDGYLAIEVLSELA